MENTFRSPDVFPLEDLEEFSAKEASLAKNKEIISHALGLLRH